MDRSEKAKRARAWLSSLRLAYKRDEDTEPLPKDEYGMNIIDALDVALDALAPPIGSGHCSWVFLPDPDLMPYEHIGACTALNDKLDGLSDDDKDSTGKDLYNIWITDEERRALEMAVLIYKSILFDVNQPTVKAKIEEMKEKHLDDIAEWFPATELPETGHWYKVRGKDAFACGYAILAETEWGSIDWIMNGFIHLNTEDGIVTEWRYLTDEEMKKEGE